MKKYLDLGNLIVMVITFALFIIALFVKGITKDLLLEAGVLLVSIKLIISNYRTAGYHEKLQQDMDEIKNLLKSSKVQ